LKNTFISPWSRLPTQAAVPAEGFRKSGIDDMHLIDKRFKLLR